MTDAVTPFRIDISDTSIDDLKRRLAATRYPDPETVEDWQQGVPLAYLQELVSYWHDAYDMQRVADRLNAQSNWMTRIDELDIHCLHIRSRHTQATPLLLTHGWPGSVLEFLDIIEPLTNPTQHGGRAEDAFHLVIPALPGFGFSEKPRQTGTSVQCIASLWDTLMQRLGYNRYLAHGGDWGSMITQALMMQDSQCLAGHITLPLVAPDPSTLESPLPEEVDALNAMQFYSEWDSGYSKQQSTRPQTLGYGLADSPAGQLAWVVEKFAQWTDCVRNNERHPENALARDLIIDTVMMYWLTNSGASSARLYWESFNVPDLSVIERPIGVSLFPTEIFRCSERWAAQRYQQLVYFNRDIAQGGHFAAMEQPLLLTHELRAWRQALINHGVSFA
jgi:pimeloyl-ACP methyl ester carboxylesterase